MEQQTAIIYCGTKGLLKNVPVNKIQEFEKDFLMVMENSHKDVLDALGKGKLDDTITSTIEKVAADLSSKYVK